MRNGQMAHLEFIEYVPHCHIIADDGTVTWVHDDNARPIKSLPLIFWKDGTPWNEANYWAHERATSGSVELKTVQDVARHLHKYANWLELPDSPDWRHFPMTKRDRVIIKWRKHLLMCRDQLGVLAPSTTTERMNATIQFYRECVIKGFIGREAPKWKDIPVVVRYFDTTGFGRTLSKNTTDVSIPCKRAKSTRVEEGLLPITGANMTELLNFCNGNASLELTLMLKLGFFTGARVQTICGLKVANLELAVPDPMVPGLWRIAVGPGSRPHVETKGDVSGSLLVPVPLLDELKAYAYGTRHKLREVKAPKDNKTLLFITSFGNPYERKEDGKRSSAINHEMFNLRKAAMKAGFKFMQTFHFHQTRATFGTQLMQTCLSLGKLQAALEFVRDAMFHKDISTTMLYVTFIEVNKAKIEVANDFSKAFLNFSTRLGKNHA